MSNKKAVPKGPEPVYREGQLTETEIHDVLRNDRRHLALNYLYRDGVIDLRELSERIAADETGEDPAPRDVRESVYSSLHQTHLPKLDRLGIVTYHQGSKEIELERRAESVMCYTDHSVVFGLTWIQFLAGIGLVGFVVVGAASLGVPGINRVSESVWAVIFLSMIAATLLYRSRRRGSTSSIIRG